MNNKSQIYIYEHPGLADDELVGCSGWSVPLYSRNLRDFICDRARPMCWKLRHPLIHTVMVPREAQPHLCLSSPRETTVRCKRRQRNNFIPQDCSPSLRPSSETPESGGFHGGHDPQHVLHRRPQTSHADKSAASINRPSTACDKMLFSKVSSGLWFTFYLPTA